MSRTFPVNNFERIKDIIMKKHYNEESEKINLIENDVQYLEKLHELQNHFPFLQEKVKIEKVEKIVAELHDKTGWDIHIGNLKQALSQELVLKKVHRVIKFNQNAWLQPFIDMNTDLRKKEKNDFEQDLFKLMNNAVFGKAMKNVRKYRDIKNVATKKRRNDLVSEPNYHTTKFFTEHLLAKETKKKTEIPMNKPA